MLLPRFMSRLNPSGVQGKDRNTTGMIDASHLGHEHEMHMGATFTDHSLSCTATA